ncbi:MAG: ATP-dependent ligase [Frankiales bacterium]|nr:ATP-dependent ligase [Frankiales bacterium]
MSPASTKVVVEVDGRQLTLSNLAKPLYPDGFTKGQVLDYYSRIAPVLLPHLAGRPLTQKRYPEGVDGHSFFEKNAPSHRPDWVRTVNLPAPGSTKDRETIDYVVVDELATLMWVANLAGLELHTPQWRVGPRGAAQDPDLLVLDLDPGPPATIVECCRVALLLRERLAEDGVEAYAKTSGSKGMQLAAKAPDPDTSAYARLLAQELEARAPDLALHRMTRSLRPGKVLVDWSQNNRAKTTISVYSLRARQLPTVSTPVSWDEVAACTEPEDLRFTTDDVLFRVEEQGDLWAALA